MTDGWRLKNLSSDRNYLDLGALLEQVLINSDLPCERLLADTDATGFGRFLSNSKLFRKQTEFWILSRVD